MLSSCSLHQKIIPAVLPLSTTPKIRDHTIAHLRQSRMTQHEMKNFAHFTFSKSHSRRSELESFLKPKKLEHPQAMRRVQATKLSYNKDRSKTEKKSKIQQWSREVLPIFPRLVNLPLDKFQTALAHILQGSSHTGPALTPAEVLVAIHDIIPERDGLPLKKITDACSACFEQRTVFTQQVLANALNQMVDQIPLPLLFMRTVIQAIDAFPKLVHFVMEILSKLVNKQVWRMPKLWVGFLKCISQTQPHSFSVLLQLPSPQLENALNKYSNLRSPLLAFVNQSNVRSSVPRSTLVLLGIAT